SGMITVNHLMLTRANRAPQKWQQAPEDAATEAQFSQLQVKVDGIQTTVSGKADKSQVTQLSDQITSVVEITDGITNANRNYVANSNFLDNANRWTFKEDAGLSYNTQSEPWIFGKKKALHIWGTPTTSFIGAWQVAPIPVASKGSIVYLSMLATKDGEPMSPIQTGLHFLDASGAVIGQVWHDFQMSEIPENSVAPARLVWKFIAPTAASSVTLMIYGLSNQYVNFYVTDIKLEINSHTPWTPALEDETTRSQVTQLSNDINLRVQKGDVINQINISPEGILIAGQKVHITGQTSIDNAVIKDAMIANVKADKITAGTLNAANVNVINLNANNITTGTIKGANLSLNLNTGEVLFQKGSIKSMDSHLLIDIDNSIIQMKDPKNAGVTLQNGNLTLQGPVLGKVQTYLEVKPLSYMKTISFGAAFVAKLSNGSWADVFIGQENSSLIKPGQSIVGAGAMIGSNNVTMAADGFITLETKQGTYGTSMLKLGGSTLKGTAKQITIQADDALHLGGRIGVIVSGDFSVIGKKNAIHPTDDGIRETPAYETAESYLGDIGESVTDESGIALISIDDLFSQIVNTNYDYQVFVSSYSDATIWVEKREKTSFEVHSNIPNAKFAFEIKAKRRGYETDRLVKSEMKYEQLNKFHEKKVTA
ncbi:gp58-like family protein, partial [Latilactobacillus curvatus]